MGQHFTKVRFHLAGPVARAAPHPDPPPRSEPLLSAHSHQLGEAEDTKRPGGEAPSPEAAAAAADPDVQRVLNDPEVCERAH